VKQLKGSCHVNDQRQTGEEGDRVLVRNAQKAYVIEQTKGKLQLESKAYGNVTIECNEGKAEGYLVNGEVVQGFISEQSYY